MAVIILFLIYVQLMLPATETVFWICFFIVFYTYAGYPLLLQVIVSIKDIISPPLQRNNIYVPVTLVVAAYNEEELIEKKIKNCLTLDYPAELIKIIFITDGSTDNTSSLLEKYPGIVHLHEPERRGKLAAMNRAMQFVTTDIVIFTDANTMLNRESVSKLLRHYSDHKVGAVSGEKRIAASDDHVVAGGEGLYWKYESWIKQLDSRLCTVVGAAGELFSLRTKLYTNLPESIIIEDFVQSLLICIKGFVVRYEPEAYSLENASISVADEKERKTRIAAGGFQAMAYLKKLLNVFAYPIPAFQYISHRVLRWTLSPLALIVMFVASLGLATAGSPLYVYFSLGQAVFYAGGVLGWIVARKGGRPGVLSLPFYFVFMNFCVFAGFARYMQGTQPAIWKKAERKI